MRPRDDNPALFRANVYKSWLVMSHVVRHLNRDCFIVHTDTPEGVGYDNLALVLQHPDGSLDLRFSMNRNGFNSTVIRAIWEQVDQMGAEVVALELLQSCGVRNPEPVEDNRVTELCDEVVAWIQNHRDQEFYVGPVHWQGSCRELLDIPMERYPNDDWPFDHHSPEISLGIGGHEVKRVFCDTRLVRKPEMRESQ